MSNPEVIKKLTESLSMFKDAMNLVEISSNQNGNSPIATLKSEPQSDVGVAVISTQNKF